MTNGNDPACEKKTFFGLPTDDKPSYGLTKRELFAAAAMQGMLASCPEGIRFNPKVQKLPWEAWAVWEIVGYLAKPNTGFVYGLNCRGDEGWWCKMEIGHIDPSVRVFETGNTAPMAICLAFLKIP